MTSDASRWRMSRRLAPTLAAVDSMCADVRQRLRTQVSPSDWYSVELLLREALTNAVLHGGDGRAGARVRCDVAVGARSARLVVADEGPGFDWRARLAAATPDVATSGRGLRIYELYADRVRFNESGNRVELRRRLGRDETRR